MSVVDTNVLIHSSIITSPHHGKARDALEFLSVATRPQHWARAATLAEATHNTDDFIRRFAVLEDGPAEWEELMALTRSFSFGGKQVLRLIGANPTWG